MIRRERPVDLEPHPRHGVREWTATTARRLRFDLPEIGVEPELVSRGQLRRNILSSENHLRRVGRFAAPGNRLAVEGHRLQDQPWGDDDELDAFPGREIDRATERTGPGVRCGSRGLPCPLERDPMARVSIGCDQDVVPCGGPVYCEEGVSGLAAERTS